MEATAQRLFYADPDADLVVAAQRDPERFIDLYDRYFPRIFRYVRMRVHHTQRAEDITSQVFLTALAHIGGFSPLGSFAAWLFRIAHNAVLDTYRARPEGAIDMELLDALKDDAPGPEAYALSRDEVAMVRRLLDTLRPEQQHLLALRYGAEMGASEIGLLLGKSPEAVRVSVHRTIKELRGRYSDDR